MLYASQSCFPVQNGLGVVLAGGLGGYLYLQKQDKLKLEEQLSSELSSERSTVDELKQKVIWHVGLWFWLSSSSDDPSTSAGLQHCTLSCLR